MVEPGRVGGGLGGPGYDVVENAIDTIERHRFFARGGEPVVVAVSGGPDSVCMLDVLARLADRFFIDPVVAHVDHRLSEGSEEVAARVGALGSQAGFDVHVARAPDLAGSNLQARARDFRYEFLELIRDKVGAERIATGHTLDDRVETTLARLIHGGGTRSLAGIQPLNGPRCRPLLRVRRAETRTYCEQRELPFYDDPANDDARFERVKVRKDVVASVERGWGEGAVRAIARSVELLSDDARALEELADNLFGQLARTADDTVVFARPAFGQLPRAFQRRLLARAVGDVRDRSGGIEAAVDALTERPPRELSFDVAEGVKIVLLGESEVRVIRMPE